MPVEKGGQQEGLFSQLTEANLRRTMLKQNEQCFYSMKYMNMRNN